MQVRFALLLAAATFTVAGCGGGAELGTVPRNADAPLRAAPRHAIVVPLDGSPAGTARLRPADAGQKTALALRLDRPVREPLSVELAHGTCRRPTALTSISVIGRVRSARTSWTVPTPYAQLGSGPFLVVVRSAARAVAACGGTHP